jgi:inner membrane protein
VDLLTQTVLGAGVGELVLGKKAGNKAILWGAVGGLIPDMDVLFTSFFNEVDGLFVHRSFTHSLFFPFIIAPIMGWLIHRIHQKKMDIRWRNWSLLIFWAAFTHPLLDYFTGYGTGAFLPLSGYRVEFNTIAIIDLFYTIPFILTLLIIPFLKRTALLRRRLILGTVFISSLYLLGTVGNKIYINGVFKDALAEQKISYDRFKTSPLPLSNFLWMGIAETETGYYMALHSNFDSDIPSEFVYIPRNEELLKSINDNKDLQKLIRFTKGYYHVNRDKNGLFLADLRFGKMGLQEDADFVFKFYLKTQEDQLLVHQSDETRSLEGDAFSAFIERIKGI